MVPEPLVEPTMTLSHNVFTRSHIITRTRIGTVINLPINLTCKRENVLCGLHNSYTMAARGFANIYTQSPRARGPRAAVVCVSKIPSSRGISDIYHLGAHSPNR